MPENELRRRSGNLPAELTSFVGRRAETAEIGEVLRSARLVTLTGVGGVGKTRLAVRVAKRLRGAFPDGAWLVELAGLPDGALLEHTIARALGIADQTARPLAEVLAEYLAERRLLMVLDGCEHLVARCAVLAESLLEAAPELSILATSRQSLGVLGERVILIGPLESPPPDVRAPGGAHDSVRLFVNRARRVVPEFALTRGNEYVVGTLCRRLDGIPLAIELAAAQLRVLSAGELIGWLDRRLELLASWETASPARHASLRAAIGWSHELCEPPERLLWARLTVFPADFDLTAARAICADAHLSGDGIDLALAGLLEKSILVRLEEPDAVRYRMLDTIREYGAQWLAELGELHWLEGSYRAYYTKLAEDAEAAWAGPDQLLWYERLVFEHRHLRATLDGYLGDGDPAETARGQRLAATLWFYWVACGFLREGRHYLDRALAVSVEPTPERLAAQWACAFVAGTQGEIPAALELAQDCRAEAAVAGDDRMVACASEVLGFVSALEGDLPAATSYLNAALAYYRSREEFDIGLMRSLPALGVTHMMNGDIDTALELAAESAALCEERGELWQRSWVEHLFAWAMSARDDLVSAARHARAAIEIKHRFHDVAGTVISVELLATAAVTAGDPARAARLDGAAQRTWQRVGLPSFGSPFYSEEHRRREHRARALIGDRPYDDAFREGAMLTFTEMVAYALDE